MENNDQPSPPSFLGGPNGRIAYRQIEGDGPTAVWLGGYASDMLGTKAAALSNDAAARGKSFLRFDYTGHGESERDFEEGTISSWFADAETAISELAPGQKILIGSSMGAWITLLYAMKYPSELSGLVLIAPAPDFTEKLHYPNLSIEQKETLERDGVLRTGTSGHPAETFTKALFDDGKTKLIMGHQITLPCPVRILHGMADDVVPTSHVMELAELVDAPSLTVTLVKGGDHRLSTNEDLARLLRTVNELRA